MYVMLPIVNSLRAGVCAYTGDAYWEDEGQGEEEDDK